MRTFIAIELPEEIKDSLGALQEKLKSSGANVKWVNHKNIHLTLKFLGEIDQERLEKIKRILDHLCESREKFKMRLSSLGAFPKINFPKVIWVGIDQAEREIKQLAKELEQALEKIGIAQEKRPFASHITLGRVRSGTRLQELIKGLNKYKDNLGIKCREFPADKITLFKSTLTPKGPIYEALHRANLTTI